MDEIDFEGLIMDDEELFNYLPEFGDDIDIDDPATIVEEDFCSERPSSSQQKKKPKSKKGKDAPRIPCTHCNKTYATPQTLKTHLDTVVLRDVASHAPNVEEVVEHMPSLIMLALTNIEEKLKIGQLAKNCKIFISDLKTHFTQTDEDLLTLSAYLSHLYSEELQFKKCATLSKIREVFIVLTNQLLNSSEFRESVKSHLLVVSTDSSLLNFFLGVFMPAVSNKVLVYAIEKMLKSGRTVPVARKQSHDFSSIDFKQSVHYIGGSIIAGSLKRDSGTVSCQTPTISDVLRASFIEDVDDDSSLCDEDVKMWTSSQNRGRLIFLSKRAYEFFQELIEFLLSLEEEDGSLLLNVAQNAVGSNFALFALWDSLTGDSVKEDVSLELLTCIVSMTCRVLSNGIIKRRLNEAIKKPVSSIALRAKVAR